MRIEREVFDDAVRRHHAAVYRTARRIVRSDADAADVAQQVFLRAWRGELPLGRDDDERRLRWLAGRLALTSLRASRRRRRHEQETAMTRPEANAPTALAADELDSVRNAVDALDDDLRSTVVLRYCEDMTLGAIGEIAGCAESTVHARLQRALEFLRQRLRDCGLALAAPRLEQLLLQVGATPIAVPATLQTALLGIPAATGTLLLTKVAAFALVALGLGGVTLAAIDAGARPDAVPAAVVVAAAPTAEPRSATSAPAARTVVAAELSASDQPQDPPSPRGGRLPLPRSPLDEARAAAIAKAPKATVAGSIARDDGGALAGVAVTAWCRALSSKGETFEIAAKSDVQGAFELALPITESAGLDYRLRLELADWDGAFAQPDLHLLPGDRRTGVDAVMHREATDEPGEWSTRAIVTDAAGRPIEGVYVGVDRRLRDAQGREQLVRECGGQTDAGGLLLLRGDHFGEKRIAVVPLGRPYAMQVAACTIAATTPPELTFALQPDTPLRVRVVDARSGEPIGKVVVSAQRDERTLAVAVSGDDGTLLLRGTDAEPCVLIGGNEPWSSFRIEGVVAGQGITEVRLKRMFDTDATAAHGCELHGRIVDAATGAPVVVDYGAVNTWWLAPDSPATAASVLADAITPWPYQTCAMGEPPPPSAEFHLAVPNPGRYALILRTLGRAVAVAGPFDLAPGQLIKDIAIRAEVGAAVTAVVRDARGAPLADAEVWLAAPGEPAAAERTLRAADVAKAARTGTPERLGRGHRTDAEGRCVFAHVPTGLELCVHAVDATGRHGGSAAFRAAGSAIEAAVVVQ